VKQEDIDLPEIVWKKYIDFEISLDQGTTNPCLLFERLIERSPHVKVWISYGTYLLSLSSKTARD
jgi:crooked neck